MECDKKGNETDLDVESDDERADIGVSGRRLIENDAGCGGSATTPYQHSAAPTKKHSDRVGARENVCTSTMFF